MANDILLKVVEDSLTAPKESKVFTGGQGTVIDLRIDVKELTGTVQVVVEESNDGVTFSDSAMTKVFDAVALNDKFVFLKQKPFHKFSFIVDGTASIEVNQG